MNSEHFEQLDEETRKKIAEAYEVRETTPEQLKREGVDRITYFERRRDALKAQTKK